MREADVEHQSLLRHRGYKITEVVQSSNRYGCYRICAGSGNDMDYFAKLATRSSDWIKDEQLARRLKNELWFHSTTKMLGVPFATPEFEVFDPSRALGGYVCNWIGGQSTSDLTVGARTELMMQIATDLALALPHIPGPYNLGSVRKIITRSSWRPETETLIGKTQTEQILNPLSEIFPPYGLCHGDFTSGHVRITDNGQPFLSGCEGAGFGWVGSDIARTYLRLVTRFGAVVEANAMVGKWWQNVHEQTHLEFDDFRAVMIAAALGGCADAMRDLNHSEHPMDYRERALAFLKLSQDETEARKAWT